MRSLRTGDAVILTEYGRCAAEEVADSVALKARYGIVRCGSHRKFRVAWVVRGVTRPITSMFWYDSYELKMELGPGLGD